MTRTVEKRTLHFDMTHLPGHDDLLLRVGSKRLPLQPHTESTLAAARAKSRALAAMPAERITHFVPDIELPGDAPLVLRVTSSTRAPGAKLDTLGLVALHLPKAVRESRIRRHRARQQALGLPFEPHPKLAMYGVPSPKDTSASSTEVIDYDALIAGVDDVTTAMDAAMTLVLHHPELVSLNADVTGIVWSTIEYANGISDLGQSIFEQAKAFAKGKSKVNWVDSEPGLDVDLTTPSSQDVYKWSGETEKWLAGPLKATLQITKNDPDLQDWSYVVQTGQPSVNGGSDAQPAMFTKLGKRTPRLTGDTTATFVTREVTPQAGLTYSEVTFDPSTQQFSMSLTNEWVRWLTVYVQFVGPDGLPVAPEGWQGMLPDEGGSGTYETDDKKYVDVISSRNTILGIPVFPASATEISFPWPTNNPSGVQILCGGLGAWDGVVDGQPTWNWDKQVCTVGAILTSVLNLALPVVFLLAGVPITSEKTLASLVKKSLPNLLSALRLWVEGPTSNVIQGGSVTSFLVAVGNAALSLILDKAPDIAKWIATEIGSEEALEDAAPVIGWIARGIAVASDLATITETTVEVLMSPPVIQLDVNAVMDVTVTVNPDADSPDQWPSTATSYSMTLVYSDGASYVLTGSLDPVTQTGPITATFQSVPAGGTVSVVVTILAANDWVAGKGQTDSIAAPVGGGSLSIPASGQPLFRITESLVPLDSSTTYSFAAKLVTSGGGVAWAQASSSVTAPVATVSSLDSSTIGPPHLAALSGITFSQLTTSLGYGWQATGQGIPICDDQGGSTEALVFSFQNITVVSQTDQLQQFAGCGFLEKPVLVYDLLGNTGGKHGNYYFDPRKGGNHIREIVLDGTTPIDTKPGRSFGRFPVPMDALAIHPGKFVAGISVAKSKLGVLPLLSSAVDDDKAPAAILFGGYGSRPGLFHDLVAIAATVDGRLLTLESDSTSAALAGAAARVQAVDPYGNPVNAFAGSTSSVFSLKAETSSVTYLDVGVESQGYVYVLKYLGDGSAASDYLLDIYQPDGTFLTQTSGIAAARLAVSLWRDVYTLNYEMVADADRTQPSASWWIPSVPATATRGT